MRLLVPALLVLFAACSPSAENHDSPEDMGGIDATYQPGCEGGLIQVDGTCQLVTNVLEVLLFRSEEPSAQVCTRRYFSADTGIEEAIVAEAGACRVIDVEQYGPLNYEPAARTDTVSIARGTESILVDEAEIFDSCVERRSIPDAFLVAGADYTIRFPGNDTVAAFEASIGLPEDPAFSRSPLTGGPVVFSWTPTAADEVVVLLSSRNINIVCQGAAATGRLEVPGSLVAMLPEPEPPREEAFTSIRLRNRETVLFPDSDAAATLTADTYQSNFGD